MKFIFTVVRSMSFNNAFMSSAVLTFFATKPKDVTPLFKPAKAIALAVAMSHSLTS